MKKTKVVSMILVTALAVGIVTSAGGEGQAAKKPQLSQKKITLKVGQTKTLRVKKQAKKAKISWKSENKKIAVVSKKGKVTAKKVGTTKVVCKVKDGTKKFTLTCKVTVKKTTPKVVPTSTVPTPAVPATSAVPTQTPSVTQPTVPTVVPTLEPTPKPTSTPVVRPSQYQVSGVFRSRNGKVLKNETIQFEGNEENYSTVTDDQGKYSVSLPEGEYTVQSYDYDFTSRLKIESGMEKTLEKDFVVPEDYYECCLLLKAENGTVLKNSYVVVSVLDSFGDTVQYLYVRTDENGVLDCLLREGQVDIKYNGNGESGLALTSTSIDIEGDIGKSEEPKDITFPDKLYEVQVNIAKNSEWFHENDSYKVCAEGAGQKFLLEENPQKEQYEGYLPEKEYAFYIVAECSDEAEAKQEKKFYLETIELKENICIATDSTQFYKVKLNVQTESDYGYNLLYANGMSIAYEREKMLYLPAGKYRVTGKFSDFNNTDISKRGLYVIDHAFDISKEETVDIPVVSYVCDPITLDTPIQTSVSKMMEDTKPYSNWYAFVPQETAEYEIRMDVEENAEVRESIDAEGYCYDDKYSWLTSCELYDFKLGADEKMQVSMKTKMEAGKTYYLFWSFYAHTKTDVPISIRITKS